MNIPNAYDIELIERYLRNELERKELDKFENSLSTDPNLAKQVDQLRSLPNDLLILEKERLSKQVKQWIKEDQNPDYKKTKPRKSSSIFNIRIIGYAASIVLLLTVSGLFLLPLTNAGLDSKVQAFIDDTHKSPTVLRASLDEQWSKAIQEYNEGDFDTMIATMNPIIETGAPTTEQYFYFALANLYLEEEQYDVALEYFDLTQQQDPAVYLEDISWYKALIFLKRNEGEKAKTQLMKIQSSSKYGTDASTLLADIK